MSSVGIIGGGITGLSAAWKLSQLGIPFTLYESSNRLGGMVGSSIRDGFLVERGPNTILETSPQITELIATLAIEHRRIFPNGEAKRRYIVKGRQLHVLPQSAIAFLRTPLLSPAGTARVAFEPLIRRRSGTEDEPLSRFVERRLGHEILDYFVNPFVGGVYAGDPGRLSVEHAFPKLYQLEKKYGSLIAGTLLGARARARSTDKSKLKAKMFTFDGGLQVLIDALEQSVNERVELGRAADSLERVENGWHINFSGGLRKEHSTILLCAPAHRLAQLQVSGRPDLQFLQSIHYPPIARVTFGFRREQIAHPLDGFGALVPAKEGLQSLGLFFSSSLFPGRAPKGHVVITVFLGGSRNPELCASGEQAVTRAALSDLSRLLGVEGGPVFADMKIIPQSIPQYEVGFGEIKAAMAHLERSAPGLFLAGNYRDGISVADSILSGLRSIDRLKEYLQSGKTGNPAYQHRVA
jgi:oxygen-dependent protoporphyrinogen oxidase